VVSIFLIKLILENRHKGEAIAYSLILGGAMGNLIDRVFRGYGVMVISGVRGDRRMAYPVD
jgi:lipoprotein signal peptidase